MDKEAEETEKYLRDLGKRAGLITEADIECKAERIMNVLDRAYMRGDIDGEMYDLLVKDIDEWVQEELKKVKLIL